jgi:hypothetical protein
MLLPEGRAAGIGLSSVGIVAGPKSAHITGKDKQGLAVLAVRPSRPPSIGAGSLWQAGAWQGWRQDPDADAAHDHTWEHSMVGLRR